MAKGHIDEQPINTKTLSELKSIEEMKRRNLEVMNQFSQESKSQKTKESVDDLILEIVDQAPSDSKENILAQMPTFDPAALEVPAPVVETKGILKNGGRPAIPQAPQSTQKSLADVKN